MPPRNTAVETLFEEKSFINLIFYYCKKWDFQPLTVFMAMHIGLTVDINGWGNGLNENALAAACIFAATKLRPMAKIIHAHEVSSFCDVQAGGTRTLWEAYRVVWDNRHELLFGLMGSIGADVRSLPEPVGETTETR